jgi:cell division protein FtsI/penicillin-binding protein 2
VGCADNVSFVATGNELSSRQQALWANAALLKTPVKNKYNLPPLLASKTDALMNLTQTAIGQSLYVTPLDMAQIATLAATGLWLKPTLIKQWQDSDEVVPIDKLELAPEIKHLIHAGLAAVVQVGTAEKAFAHHPDRCRLYGKTGTAQVGSQGKALAPYNSAWFIGWREPKAVAKNSAARLERKLAFACMITHTAKTETGGSICAPLMANFFTGINAK